MELTGIIDKEKNNLLNFAVQSGYYDIVELLIKHGLPINSKNVTISTIELTLVIREYSTALCNRLQACQDDLASDRQRGRRECNERE